ncbi:hypothetical protein GCM10010515_73520 [Streptomyces fructofermentans]|uniref:Uncharacterized protein n=1 Tax=Streptomyces fructofermentans TaxID=152141 RepID=A0A918NTW2_9ACTN|nr:hypothetical protein GCM10010515_73520 [Streptomyces fructofermentans]
MVIETMPPTFTEVSVTPRTADPFSSGLPPVEAELQAPASSSAAATAAMVRIGRDTVGPPPSSDRIIGGI